MTATPIDAGSQDTSTALLDVRRLRKVYAGRGHGVEAVRDLTFTVGAGELVCIVGPSGAGKTTLLRCVAGLLECTSGEVTLQGRKVTGPPPGMAMVFQEYGRSLFPRMTVRQNVERPLKEKRVPRADRQRLVREAPWRPSAWPRSTTPIPGGCREACSSGWPSPERSRTSRKLLLMDEPFAAVDAQTRADLEDLVRALWNRLGVTVLFVTHDIDESVYLGQRVIVLSNSPTVVLEEVAVGLPGERDQLTTRSAPRFAELRAHIYRLVQQAKEGRRPGD